VIEPLRSLIVEAPSSKTQARPALEPCAPIDDKPELDPIVDALHLANARRGPLGRAAGGHRLLPSLRATARIVDDLRMVLFPWHFGPSQLDPDDLRAHLTVHLEQARSGLLAQIQRCLTFDCAHRSRRAQAHCHDCEVHAQAITQQLLASLPRIRGLLEMDAQAAYDGDPAVRFLDETLFCYPGVTAITQHRIAHELYLQKVPLLPRLISELAHSNTGIDIHPGAQIGASFFIDHGTGVVIGETCQIGKRVRIYQGVTLGARGFECDGTGHVPKGGLRHPVIEDDVVIYAGATLLGRITVGRGATIGGNVWLTRDVEAGSRVTQAQAHHRLFRDGAGI
jgi:serine O-acetyltransferase